MTLNVTKIHMSPILWLVEERWNLKRNRFVHKEAENRK